MPVVLFSVLRPAPGVGSDLSKDSYRVGQVILLVKGMAFGDRIAFLRLVTEADGQLLICSVASPPADRLEGSQCLSLNHAQLDAVPEIKRTAFF